VAVESLWKTLERLLRERGLGALLELDELREAWERIVPGRLRGARPLVLKGGVLYLGAPNHLVAQEIRLRRHFLVRSLRKAGYAVQEIRVQVLPPPHPPLPAAEPVVEIQPEDIDWALGELQGKELPQGLRRAFVGLLAAARARERALLAAGGKTCRKCGTPFLGPGDLCPTCLIHVRHGGEG